MNTEITMARAGQPFVVVEIGNDRLKMLHAVPGPGGGTAIADLWVERISASASGLAEAIAKVLKRWSGFSGPAILCLPRQLVSIRHLELPSGEPPEIADMIAIQAGKLTPWSREEVSYDYRLLGSDRPGYTRAMLVIAQRDVFRQRYFIAEEAGLAPERLTISFEGLLLWTIRALQTASEPAAVAVLDVDSFYSDFLIVHGDRPLYSRGILTGADQLLENAAAATQQLAREVAQSIELAARETGGISPSRIVVTGASGPADALIDVLRAQTGLPCERCDVLAGLSGSVGLNGMQLLSPVGGDAAVLATTSVTPLIGLAMAPERLEINMLPESVRRRRDLKRHATLLTWVGTAVLAVMVSASLLAHTFFLIRRERLAQIRERIEATAQDADRVGRQHELVLQATRYLDPRKDPIRLLTAVQAALLPEIALEGLEWDGTRERLTINGTASAIRDVRSLLNAIAETAGFEDVREDGSMSQDNRTGRFKFKIVCSLAAIGETR